MDQNYARGFGDTCARYGVSPEEVVKAAEFDSRQWSEPAGKDLDRAIKADEARKAKAVAPVKKGTKDTLPPKNTQPVPPPPVKKDTDKIDKDQLKQELKAAAARL